VPRMTITSFAAFFFALNYVEIAIFLFTQKHVARVVMIRGNQPADADYSAAAYTVRRMPARIDKFLGRGWYLLRVFALNTSDRENGRRSAAPW
jgi:hypothetical protein